MQVKMWAITYRQSPIFYLHPDMSGIVSEDHARRIAAKILGFGGVGGEEARTAAYDPNTGSIYNANIDAITAVLVDIDGPEPEKKAVLCPTCEGKGYVEYVWTTGFMRGHRCGCALGRSRR